MNKASAVLVAALAVAGGTVLPAGGAQAATSIHQVSCAGAHNVFVVQTTAGNYCFQGSGSMSTNLRGVYRVYSSVSGHFWGDAGGASQEYFFSPGSNYCPVASHISSITIS